MTVTGAFAFKLARRPVGPVRSSILLPSFSRGVLDDDAPSSPPRLLLRRPSVANPRSREPRALSARHQGTPVRIWPRFSLVSRPNVSRRVAVVLGLVLAVVVVADEVSSASERARARAHTHTRARATTRDPRRSRTSRIAHSRLGRFGISRVRGDGRFGSPSCRDTPPVSVIDNGRTASASSRPACADRPAICRRDVAGLTGTNATGPDICVATGKTRSSRFR